MQVPQCFYSSTLSLDGAALCAHHRALLVLCSLWVGQPHICVQQHPTHATWSSPVCGYHSALPALHCPHMCMWQHPTICTLSLDGATLHVGNLSILLSLCSLQASSLICMSSLVGAHSSTLPYPLDQSLGGRDPCT